MQAPPVLLQLCFKRPSGLPTNYVAMKFIIKLFPKSPSKANP
jgi:hypothetical protein